MAQLNYSHSENWCGLVSDFYYCSDCIQQYAFQHGTLPEIEKCSNCGAEFEGADLKLDTNERDCEHCVHYKEYKDGLYACEKWECEYERRENNDGADA